ncbi:MAG TPA: tripartite tricarboxylate transporter substrate binding protein [Burkholderiaceae bacterium]|nr:tripartite tricarboxylate transporter substrate binding protein [Burkholderiaceae bacterium]
MSEAVRPFRRALLALACTLALPAVAHAQAAWPSKPIRLVVTFPPGGSSDIVARLIAPIVGERLGQPVVVENRPGAGSTIGAAEVARAAPDGYTFMLSNTAPISLSPQMLDKPTYDPVKGFTHVAYVGSVPNVFVVHPDVPAKTLPEFVAWAKKAGQVNYGSGGIGSIGHIVGETFKNEAKIDLEHVGYKGSAPMHNDLLGGTIRFAVDTLPQNVPFARSGKLRMLAVTSRSRASMAPEVPTVVELGMPNLVAENFFGVSAPAGLPRPIAERMHAAVAAALDDPKVRRTFEETGIDTRRMSIDEFGAFVSKQVSDWAPAVRASGARLN